MPNKTFLVIGFSPQMTGKWKKSEKKSNLLRSKSDIKFILLDLLLLDLLWRIFCCWMRLWWLTFILLLLICCFFDGADDDDDDTPGWCCWWWLWWCRGDGLRVTTALVGTGNDNSNVIFSVLQTLQVNENNGFFNVHFEHDQNSPFRNVMSLATDSERNFEPQHASHVSEWPVFTNVHFLHVHFCSSSTMSSPAWIHLKISYKNHFLICFWLLMFESNPWNT